MVLRKKGLIHISILVVLRKKGLIHISILVALRKKGLIHISILVVLRKKGLSHISISVILRKKGLIHISILVVLCYAIPSIAKCGSIFFFFVRICFETASTIITKKNQILKVYEHVCRSELKYFDKL